MSADHTDQLRFTYTGDGVGSVEIDVPAAELFFCLVVILIAS